MMFFLKFLLVIALMIAMIAMFYIITRIIDYLEKRKGSSVLKEELKQQIISLTFDQRVAHMQKCFDAAEKITTLAWGESTGSITIQLYLDTIDEIGKELNGK